LAKRINKATVDFNKKVQADVHVFAFDDNSRWVQRRLSLLLGDAFTGFLLVTLFLMFFLKPRSGFETALEIPSAFLMTLLFMKLFGISINVISMIGLIMVAGMLVDDAIIISENIHRHLEMGKSPKQAALEGINEVAAPVAITIITTILGFLPLALMTGIIGQILKIIPMIVIFALVASGLQSYFSLPTNIVEASEHAEPHDPNKIALKDKVLNAIAKKYHDLALPLFKRKKLAIGFVVFTLVFSIFFAGAKMRFTFIPEEGVEIFFITTEAPIGTTLEKNHEFVKKIEKKLATYPKGVVVNYVSSIGSTGFGQRDSELETGKRLAQVAVYLTAGNQRSVSTDQIMEEMRKYVESLKVFKEFIVDQANYGPPAPKPIYIKLTGPDFAVLDKVGKDIFEYVKKIPGTKEVQYSFKAQNPEMHLRLREGQIARFGLTSRDVAREIRAAFDGIKVGEMLVGNDTLDIRVKLNMPEKEIRDVLRNIYIDNHRGGFIPLPQLVDIEETTGPSRIIHEGGLRLISIQGKIDIKKGSVKEVLASVKKKFPDPFKGDIHYNLEFAGENKETNESLQSMGQLFIAAIILVFFCLVAFFNSMTLPLIVMVSIPFSIIGVIWAFFIHGQAISFPALMGMVGLGGVVVKDGIVLVSFIEQLRREGMGAFEAVEKATQLRVRPIIITTGTTIAGLLPTAYGIGGYDPFIKPLALAFAWGLGFSTFLTLFMLPAIYLAHEEWVVKHPQFKKKIAEKILGPVKTVLGNIGTNLWERFKLARS
jgi:multidrug efflux pump subunit AcrB